MLEQPQSSTTPESDLNIEEIVQSLRRKEGNWVRWGQACQQLQKAGYSPQSIFEGTGFEPIHQNQIIVGAQVYTTLKAAPAPEALLAHYEAKGSDILYEFRILNQTERLAAAALAVEKQLNADEARDVAKAIKDFSRLRNPPEAFTKESGDVVAYRCWRLARQQEDLQERSRLIAQGLRFTSSESARKEIEQLLTDFTVTKEHPAPPLPVYRLESETELPRMVPCLGKLPLIHTVLESVASVEVIGPFQQIHAHSDTTWVAIPGWQVILQAENPVALVCDSEGLPASLQQSDLSCKHRRAESLAVTGSTLHDSNPIAVPGNPLEEVLIVVDRAQCRWDLYSYFLVTSHDQLEIQWFEQEPDNSLLGRVILVLRPKKVLDENYIQELWQLDE